MTPDQYQTFTATLLANLSADPRVLGLIAAGSMAGTHHQPDQWSDHDFWIVTEPGAQEHFRTIFDWLPHADQIVFTMRETEHGLKLLYADGHFVEYAVFAPEELAVTKINAYKILLDRERIAARVNEVRAATVTWAAERKVDDAFLFGQFIT
ncbi:MAG: hypothetical protein JW910_23275, partial [Anaerolineae bacterium]|nr:hypothetical protein [Anaerolineae bacterium]